MIIKKRIKLGQGNYYICLDCKYKVENGNKYLRLKDYKDDYYDSGDLSKLIEKIENNYHNSKKYDNDILFLSDCIYIYNNIPFISGIECVILSSSNILSSLSYISKEELDVYIKENNIKLNMNDNFKLSDESTWIIC